MSAAQLIRDRCLRKEHFTLAEVREWMRSEDLEICEAVEQICFRADLVRPTLEMEDACEFLVDFYLRCIRENVRDHENIPNGFEAAWELDSWMKFWARRLPDMEKALSDTARKITAAYLKAGDEERTRIEHGTLEHVLELPSLRPFFRRWEHDPALSEAWHNAMEWALAHEKS